MSSDTLARTHVLRGPLAHAVRGAAMDADLAVVAPVDVDSAEAAPPPAESPAVAEAREQAARVGYEDGFEAGSKAAAAQAREQVDAYAAQLAQALAAVDAAASGLTQRQNIAVADVEQQIVTMALEIAEAVVGRSIAVAHDPGMDAIVRALRLAPERAEATARLHPDDVATLGDLAMIAGERGISVVADTGIEPGGCILEVGACRIDAQVSPAMERVRQVLQP